MISTKYKSLPAKTVQGVKKSPVFGKLAKGEEALQQTLPAAKATKAAKADAATKATTDNKAILQARANVAAKAPDGIGVTLHTSGAPIKGLMAEPVLAKPQRKMLQMIDKIIGHPGVGNCIKRFHLYKPGMTLLHCKVTPGLIVSDVTFYASLGYLTLRPATDAEYAAVVAEWEKGRKAA